MTIEPSAVVEFVPERKLVWTGGMFPILMGRHYFEFVNLYRLRMPRRRSFTGEEFGGLFPLFAGRNKMLALSPAYERFNEELAARVECRHYPSGQHTLFCDNSV
jgi:hypothetical protein